MIKNRKQAKITDDKILELKKSLESFQQVNLDRNSPKYKLGVKAFNALISELEKELAEYHALINGSINCLQAKSLREIPKVLIAARLAQNISQRDLAKKIGVKEQQIQRYEQEDYESSSFVRITELADALNLNFIFEKITLDKTQCIEPKNYSLPSNISHQQIQSIQHKISVRNCLTLA